MPAHDPLATLFAIGLTESVLLDHTAVVRLDNLGGGPSRDRKFGDVELVDKVAELLAATSYVLCLASVSRHDDTCLELWHFDAVIMRP